MSNERDETRPFTPRSGDETRLSRPSDDHTCWSGPSADHTGVHRSSDDETRAGGPSDDETRLDWSPDGETVAQPPPRENHTSVMPPADDEWAPSRANPAWSGRAEVRAPQPDTYRETGEWPPPMGREPRDRWWMPIVVGIIALMLLAALAFGIYLIVQNSGSDENPAPPTPPAVAPTQTATTSTPSTPPSTEPTTTTTEPSPTPSTTNPTTVAIMIPALKGLPLQEAETALSNMGLSWHVILRDSDGLPGTVIDSDPAEGQEVPPDTRITLVVAQGATPPATGTPEVPGLDGD